MNIQNTILGLLLDGPLTGYELKQLFDSSLAFFAGASFGSIYPILRRCETQGLVGMRTEIQDGRPNRKVYHLTEAGRLSFLEGLKTELTVSPYRNEFLARVFFFGHLDQAARAVLFTRYLTYLEDRLVLLESLQGVANEQADPFQLMCFRFGLRHLRDTIGNIRQLGREMQEYQEQHEDTSNVQ